MSSKIEIIHRIREQMRNGDWSTEERTAYSGPLTARGVAKASRKLEEENAWVRKYFGPTVISPKHTFHVQVNGRNAEPFEIMKEDGETWAKVAADLARAYP